MNGLNETRIDGNLGLAPRITTFKDGSKVANLRVATDKTYTNRETGEVVKEVDWHNVVVRGGLVSVVEKFCQQGTRVYLSGPTRTRKYQKPNVIDQATGEPVDLFITEVVVGPMGTVFRVIGNREVAQQDADANAADAEVPF